MAFTLVDDAGLRVTEDKDFGQVTSTLVVGQTFSSPVSPPMTKHYGDQIALTAGALTVDMADMVGGIDFSGLKPQAFMIVNTSTTAFVSMAGGATNGHNILGVASGLVGIAPNNGYIKMYAPEFLQDVAGADKTIDFASTDLTASLKIIIIAG